MCLKVVWKFTIKQHIVKWQGTKRVARNKLPKYWEYFVQLSTAGNILTNPPLLSNWAFAILITLDSSGLKVKALDDNLSAFTDELFFGRVLLKPSAECTLLHYNKTTITSKFNCEAPNHYVSQFHFAAAVHFQRRRSQAVGRRSQDRIDSGDSHESKKIGQHGRLQPYVQRTVAAQRRRQIYFQQPRFQIGVDQNIEPVKLCSDGYWIRSCIATIGQTHRNNCLD